MGIDALAVFPAIVSILDNDHHDFRTDEHPSRDYSRFVLHLPQRMHHDGSFFHCFYFGISRNSNGGRPFLPRSRRL